MTTFMTNLMVVMLIVTAVLPLLTFLVSQGEGYGYFKKYINNLNVKEDKEKFLRGLKGSELRGTLVYPIYYLGLVGWTFIVLLGSYVTGHLIGVVSVGIYKVIAIPLGFILFKSKEVSKEK